MRARIKAPLLRTVEAASFIMHDSDIFQWMKAGADAFCLTGSSRDIGRRQAVPMKIPESYGAR
jgi:hypothetical protein